MISESDSIVDAGIWNASQPAADPVDDVGPPGALVDADFFILQSTAKDPPGLLDFPAVKQAVERSTR